jgi:hypothetical protein
MTMTADDLEYEYELTSGEDLVQDGEATGDKGEYAYTLPAFVPRSSTASDATTAPSEAATWIIPDIDAAEYFRAKKVFKTTWLDKVPASFNLLFIRVQQRKPDPTPFQAALLNTVVSKFTQPGDELKVSQVVLLPVINLYEGEAISTLAEMGVEFYKELKKQVAKTEAITNGSISNRTHAFRVWRGPKQRDYGVLPDVKAPWDVKRLLSEYQPVNPIEYVKIRAVLTEQWWLDKWKAYRSGETTTFSGGATREERFIDAVSTLPTARLKQILAQNGIKTEANNRAAYIEAAQNNMEAVESAVLTTTAALSETGSDKHAESEVPF